MKKIHSNCLFVSLIFGVLAYPCFIHAEHPWLTRTSVNGDFKPVSDGLVKKSGNNVNFNPLKENES